MEELKLRMELVDAEPQEVFEVWLDPEGHAAMTGSPATGKPEVGAEFTAWDGYISGQNVALEPPRRILQTWRTSEFSADESDSEVEVLLESNEDGGTLVTILHTRLPDGTAEKYATGWEEHYFDPMREFFGQTTWAEETSEEE